MPDGRRREKRRRSKRPTETSRPVDGSPRSKRCLTPLKRPSRRSGADAAEDGRRGARRAEEASSRCGDARRRGGAELRLSSRLHPRKKQRKSRRHVPRSLRRTRSKVKREPAKHAQADHAHPEAGAERGRRQERRGVVVSDKGDKTIVVKVDVIKMPPEVQEGRPPLGEVPRARRGEHRRRRRHGAHRRDAPAVEDEALAARRDRREGE